MKSVFSFLVLFSLWSIAQVDEINLSGIYVVPTSDKSLTEAAQFKVTDYKVIGPNSNDPAIQFTLPIELTGIPNHLEFKRVIVLNTLDKSSIYSSPFGSALCYGAWKVLKCFFKFNDLSIDKHEVTQILASNFSGQELIRKATVTKVFQGEPVGILQIETKAGGK